MRRTRNALLVAGTVLLFSVPVFLFLPARVHPVIVDDAQARQLVSCGSLVTPGSSDDACEGPILARLGSAVLVGSGAVLCGGAALVVHAAGRRRG